MKIKEISALLNKKAAYNTAYDFDNVGLLVGDGEREVNKIMLALDASPEVVAQASAVKAQLLITHHPLIFKPIKSVTADTANGQILLKLIENNIALIAMHTNLDIAQGGVNDVLAELLGLQDIRTVVDKQLQEFVKFAVFVPKTHTQILIDALDELHIHIFGNYESCSFTSTGTGRFKPLDGAKPFIGVREQPETVAEDKIELLLPQFRVVELIAALKAVHPYEQMAYEIMPLLEPYTTQGILRIGHLPQPMVARQLAIDIKQRLGIEYVLFTNPDKQINTIAVCGGAGADFAVQAQAAGADALLTGDVKYHEAQEAKYTDFSLMAIGHQESETPVIEQLHKMLSAELAGMQIEISVAKQDKILHCI